MKLKGGDLGLLLDLQKRAVTWDLPMILREDEKYIRIYTPWNQQQVYPWKLMVGSSKSTFLLGQKAYFFAGLVGIRSFPFGAKCIFFQWLFAVMFLDVSGRTWNIWFGLLFFSALSLIWSFWAFSEFHEVKCRRFLKPTPKQSSPFGGSVNGNGMSFMPISPCGKVKTQKRRK